jgi:murein DD-endopeptidase MepM/ murein hydrolase activator NlpD
MVAACNSEIRAARSGRVVEALESGNCQNPPDSGTCSPDCGLSCCSTNIDDNRIVIRHQDGSFGRYLHVAANSIGPELGDLVRRGELIALMGSVGNSSGSHLHFEVREDLTPNPNCAPYGTILPLFEAADPDNPSGPLLRCYEPEYLVSLKSTNVSWP